MNIVMNVALTNVFLLHSNPKSNPTMVYSMPYPPCIMFNCRVYLPAMDNTRREDMMSWRSDN